MKKILLLCCTLFAATICLAAKEVKITVIPSDAKIYIDGNYAADGITTATLKKKKTALLSLSSNERDM